jgi:hypothetical protein
VLFSWTPVRLILLDLNSRRVGNGRTKAPEWRDKTIRRSGARHTYACGFDAQVGEFGDMIARGIIDPTKVVRIALQDEASIAGLLITTEAMVAEKPKKETPMPAVPPVVDGLLTEAVIAQEKLRRN